MSTFSSPYAHKLSPFRTNTYPKLPDKFRVRSPDAAPAPANPPPPAEEEVIYF